MAGVTPWRETFAPLSPSLLGLIYYLLSWNHPACTDHLSRCARETSVSVIAHMCTRV